MLTQHNRVQKLHITYRGGGWKRWWGKDQAGLRGEGRWMCGRHGDEEGMRQEWPSLLTRAAVGPAPCPLPSLPRAARG